MGKQLCFGCFLVSTLVIGTSDNLLFHSVYLQLKNFITHCIYFQCHRIGKQEQKQVKMQEREYSSMHTAIQHYTITVNSINSHELPYKR